MKTARYNLMSIQEDAAAKRRLLSLGKVAVAASAPRSEEASKINRAQLEADADPAATKSATLK